MTSVIGGLCNMIYKEILLDEKEADALNKLNVYQGDDAGLIRNDIL